MEKQMRELLERSFEGDKVIAYIEALEKENELLKRENKALDEEGTLKCELNQKLEKALDKACKRQADCGFCHGKTRTSEKCNDKNYCANCWKEWSMK